MADHSLCEGSTMSLSRKPKKPKYMSRWETSLYEINRNTPSLGLQRLFDSRRWLESPRKTNQSRSCCCHTTKSQNDPVTLRLEHREGGAMATHQGEERILLFRSDRKGAIGKCIISSQSDSDNMAQAKIHVLNVNSIYRGYDLGGLLFSEAILALKQRYQTRDQEDALLPAVRCQLDAEEDVRRHNKLVGFYERLGCTVRKVRPQFINNNDGETYRKVPMQIDLKAPGLERHSEAQTSSLVGCMGGFLPVLLLGSDSQRGKLSSDDHPRACWLMTDDGHGHVQFRTSKGRYLTVDPQGRCGEEESGTSGHLSIFQLLRVSDVTQHVLSGEDGNNKENVSSTEKELWILWSPHGTFLNLDLVSQNFEASKTPTFWQANSSNQLSLTCVLDTPTRRQHYRQMWIRQTVDYVLAAKERYLQFKLARLPLLDALNLIKACPAFPFRVDAASRGLSLRTLCFWTAEAARKSGHPDWIQFLALIHAMGSVVNCIDIKTAIESEDEYDWTIPCRSRVVGCASSIDASFVEFSNLNADEHDERYNKSPVGMYSPHCGLENVHLTWSGPEYLYHWLKHNDLDLPDEAISVLRFFSLYDWHSKKLYEGLVNDEDRDILSFVRDFDQMRRRALQGFSVADELTDADCERLWRDYYQSLAGKFGADDILEW